MSKVGFPIRISTDQRLFAPSRSFSQRTTSFIASYRQGIHQMPLSHLIALISNAHPVLAASTTPEKEPLPPPTLGLEEHCRKTRNSSDTPSAIAVDRRPQPLHITSSKTRNALRRRDCSHPRHISSSRCQEIRGIAGSARGNCVASFKHGCRPGSRHIQCGAQKAKNWWSQTGSNRRPEACKATALPAELWPRSVRCPLYRGPGHQTTQRHRRNGGPGKI